jgi:integrase
MRLLKQKYLATDGTYHETDHWYVEIKDHVGARHRIPAFTDSEASAEFGRKVEQLANLKAAKLEPSKDFSDWVSTLAPEHLERLASIGIIDGARVAVLKPIPEHIEDWRQALQDRGTSALQARQVAHRVYRVLVGPLPGTKRGRKPQNVPGCRFRILPEIDGEAVQACLAALRRPSAKLEDGKRIPVKAELSAQTSNHYLQACKSFVTWCVEVDRMIRNPLSGLSPLPEKVVKAGAKHARRVLREEEAAKLLDHTAGESERYGMPGAERALLYRVAIETGLRAGELEALTVGNLDLKSKPPAIWLGDGKPKSGKDADIPLLEDTAALLLAHVANRLPSARVFKMPKPYLLANMIEADLKAAGLEYKNAAGRFADFHALRHCTATYLLNRGVSPMAVRDIMRHADLKTTMRYAARTLLVKRQEAIEALPRFSEMVKEERAKVAVGAENASVMNESDSRPTLPLTAPLTEKSGKRGARSGTQAHESPMKVEPPLGIEPRTYGLQNTPADSLTSIQAKDLPQAENRPYRETYRNGVLTLDELRAAVERCADLDARTRRAVLALLAEEE